MNIQQAYYNRTIVLQNLLNRIIPTRGRENSYSLKGVITQEERNAIVIGLNEIRVKLHSFRLSGDNRGEFGEIKEGELNGSTTS